MIQPRLPSIAFVLLLSAASGMEAPCRAAEPDPSAVARKTLGAMGGAEAFSKVRTLRFDFVVVREGAEVARARHVWDRADGRYRLESKTKDKKSLLVILNVNDRGKGRAWLDGEEQSGEKLNSYLDAGYGRFINDTYWLLMPAKMLDPGVKLASEGEHPEGGKTYDVVRETFDSGIGLTPGDTYWAYVSTDTGLMERWDFVLQGQKTEDRATFLWEDWRDVGAGVRLSLSKRTPDGKTIIRFENVSASTAPDEGAFISPPGKS